MNIMDRLTAARPGWLDPSAPDHDRRYRDLEAALSQEIEHVRSRHRARRVYGFGLGGLVAAGTAAAVVAAVTASGGGTVRPGAAKAGTPGIVLAAAERAEQQPLGAYWYTDEVEASSFLVPARTGAYAIAGAANEWFQWTSVRPGGGNLFYGRDLPAKPLTPADEEAWRRAGSPTSFRVWAGDHYDTFTTGAGRWSADYPAAQKGGRFLFTGFPKQICADGTPRCAKPGMGGATVDDLMNLPTDTASLRARYLNAAGEDGARGPRVNPVAVDVLYDVERDLRAPVPPKLRAGLIRMLATIPGVRQIPSVTDVRGRQGFAFATVRPAQPYDKGSGSGGYSSEFELTFDKNGSYLGAQEILVTPGGTLKDRKPGFVIGYSLVRSGWTNVKPTPPTSLPTSPAN